jgi:predicted amidohydrolase YtcJ
MDPDLLVVGTIHTLDPALPRAGAVLVRAGRIACVGPAGYCAARAETGAGRIDLGVGSAVPGMADAHGHVLAYARSLEEVSCSGLRSADECVQRAAIRARTLPPGAWVLGRGWDQNLWEGGAFPTEEALSAAVPDRPVFLGRVDGHAAWVNERALALAGIGPGTPDPPGGRILRHPDGRPTGVLVDAAMERALARIPEPSPAARERLLAAGLAALSRQGLTAVHDAGVDPATLEAYARLARADQLPLRVYAMIDGMQPEHVLRAQLARWGAEPEIGRLTVRAVKIYADGALGSRGAALLAPYADEPGTTGLLLLDPAALRARIALAARAGFQPAVHAIGDRACRAVLDAFLAVDSGGGLRRLRPRIEHLQVLRAEDAPRLGRVGAVASMQPVHAVSDGPWAERRLGHGTPAQRGAYAWRQALDGGGVLAFGSDFPVESPDPRLGLFAAEARIPDGATEAWMAEQRLGRQAALLAFTAGAAFASFAEGRRGRIREGLDGDLTLLGADLMAVPVEDLVDVPVRATVVGGRVEYER